MSDGIRSLSRAETIEPYTPTIRDRARGGVESLISAFGGGPGYASKVARDTIGTPEAFGLADASLLGIPMAAQEGTRAAIRGAQAGDPLATGLGAGEALLAVTPFGPAARGTRTMAPAGGRRGGGGPPEQVKPDMGRKDPELEYKIERVMDPETGRFKTVFQPRSSGAETGATRARIASQKKAAPAPGAEARLDAPPPPPTPTADLPTPTEFRLVRAPLGDQPTATPGTRTAQAQSGATSGRRIHPDAVKGDPAHEWLEVPTFALERMGFNTSQFTNPASRLSPDGQTAYLASGPDSAKFLRGWQQQAEFFGLPKQPKLKAPTALPSMDVFNFPRPTAPGPSAADIRQQARGTTIRSEGPPPKSKFFD